MERVRETYNSAREWVGRNELRLGYTGLLTGVAMMAGGGLYSISPVDKHLDLQRYERIQGKLDSSLKLKDIGQVDLRSTTARANRLRVERDRIMTNQEFVEMRREYKNEVRGREYLSISLIVGGFLFAMVTMGAVRDDDFV